MQGAVNVSALLCAPEDERVEVLRRRTGPTPEVEVDRGSSGSRDRSATSQTSTRSGARSTCDIHGRESNTEVGLNAATAQSGRRARREAREEVLCVLRRLVELHEDVEDDDDDADALNNCRAKGAGHAGVNIQNARSARRGRHAH